MTPKSPKGDFFKLLIFSSYPLGVRGKDGKNQQFEGFLYCTHLIVVLNLCILSNSKLTPVQNLKRLDFDKNMLFILHSCI
ncbi:MAG: hypothetical protein JG782_1852 [Anaerophaga sp.]|nr:hypothetical protein [Anaerophaga sp.]MDK2841319.1 hypothetical protein [Anaerophaga sp.]MDN5291902.1 hypothetical protein [Anaerophaga sp.]